MHSKDYFHQVADQGDNLQASFYSDKARDRVPSLLILAAVAASSQKG